MRKDQINTELLHHALQLQQSLIEIEKDIDGHLLIEKAWNQVLESSNWIKIHCDITLGTQLSGSLDRINTINREGGPNQGNIMLISEALMLITTFIGTLRCKKKAA